VNRTCLYYLDYYKQDYVSKQECKNYYNLVVGFAGGCILLCVNLFMFTIIIIQNCIKIRFLNHQRKQQDKQSQTKCQLDLFDCCKSILFKYLCGLINENNNEIENEDHFSKNNTNRDDDTTTNDIYDNKIDTITPKAFITKRNYIQSHHSIRNCMKLKNPGYILQQTNDPNDNNENEEIFTRMKSPTEGQQQSSNQFYSSQSQMDQFYLQRRCRNNFLPTYKSKKRRCESFNGFNGLRSFNNGFDRGFYNYNSDEQHSPPLPPPPPPPPPPHQRRQYYHNHNFYRHDFIDTDDTNSAFFNQNSNSSKVFPQMSPLSLHKNKNQPFSSTDFGQEIFYHVKPHNYNYFN
jgi:hypothetical protein